MEKEDLVINDFMIHKIFKYSSDLTKARITLISHEHQKMEILVDHFDEFRVPKDLNKYVSFHAFAKKIGIYNMKTFDEQLKRFPELKAFYAHTPILILRNSSSYNKYESLISFKGFLKTVHIRQVLINSSLLNMLEKLKNMKKLRILDSNVHSDLKIEKFRLIAGQVTELFLKFDSEIMCPLMKEVGMARGHYKELQLLSVDPVTLTEVLANNEYRRIRLYTIQRNGFPSNPKPAFPFLLRKLSINYVQPYCSRYIGNMIENCQRINLLEIHAEDTLDHIADWFVNLKRLHILKILYYGNQIPEKTCNEIAKNCRQLRNIWILFTPHVSVHMLIEFVCPLKNLQKLYMQYVCSDDRELINAVSENFPNLHCRQTHASIYVRESKAIRARPKSEKDSFMYGNYNDDE